MKYYLINFSIKQITFIFNIREFIEIMILKERIINEIIF